MSYRIFSKDSHSKAVNHFRNTVIDFRIKMIWTAGKNYAGGENWSSLIDSAQYGGPLLYPEGEDAEPYNWYDADNTELWHELPDGWGDHKFWGGVTYRPKDAVVLMVGADVGAVRLGYSYDIGVTPLAKASHGSHELMVTYSYKLDLDKRKQHAHKSIRIL